MTRHRSRRHRLTAAGKRVLKLALEIGMLALGVHLLLPQLAGLRATGRALARATWWLPLIVLLLEIASLAAYGELVLVVLRRAGQRATRGFVQRAVVVGTSLGRTLPGGTTTALAVVVSAFRRNGLDVVAATTSMATAGMLSSAVLAALLPIGVGMAMLTGHLGGIALSAVVAASAVLAGVALVPVVLSHPEGLADIAERGVRLVARGPLRRVLDPAVVRNAVLSGVEGVRALGRDRRALSRSVGWAAANWLLDVGVVAVLAATLGQGTPLSAILLAYVIAQIVAALPLTPGGVGVVEPAMIGALVASGAPASAATATVLGWRLISHWLPIGVGLVLLPTVTRSGRAVDDEPPEESEQAPSGSSTT